MKIKIHRGAEEIGGNCVEVEAAGKRLVLDLGRPLWAGQGDEVALPEVQGLGEGKDPSLLGLVISHPHQDHFGLAGAVGPDVPVSMGEAAWRIIDKAGAYVPGMPRLAPKGFLEHKVPLQLGPFTITPFLVDHSAYDAYALLVEAEGKRVFYTGDLRAHGRKGRLFEALVKHPPEGVDVILMEGTHVAAGPGADRLSSSEDDVEKEFFRLATETEGMLLVSYSGQNIDRLVSLCRAALQTGRQLVLDLYGAMMARATGNAHIPQAEWEVIRVFVPEWQRKAILKGSDFKDINSVHPSRIYPEDLKVGRSGLIMTLRASNFADLEETGCLEGACAVWSMWDGYLEEPSGQRIQDFLKRNAIPLHKVHASGHASIEDLTRLVGAFGQARVVPIHSFGGDRFKDLFPRVERHRDGEWWEV